MWICGFLWGFLVFVVFFCYSVVRVSRGLGKRKRSYRWRFVFRDELLYRLFVGVVCVFEFFRILV